LANKESAAKYKARTTTTISLSRVIDALNEIPLAGISLSSDCSDAVVSRPLLAETSQVKEEAYNCLVQSYDPQLPLWIANAKEYIELLRLSVFDLVDSSLQRTVTNTVVLDWKVTSSFMFCCGRKCLGQKCLDDNDLAGDVSLFLYHGQDACINNVLDGGDSRVQPDDHLLGSLANNSLTVTWNDQPLSNLTLDYGSVGTLAVNGNVPPGAAIVYSRLSESFRHAGSLVVSQTDDKIAPVTWTFDRVGTFTVATYMVTDFAANVDNEKCMFYAGDAVTFKVVTTDGMIALGDNKSFPECSLCPKNEILAKSDVGVFVPSSGVEQTCSGWYQDGLQGKLNTELCAMVQQIEANGTSCRCDIPPVASAAVERFIVFVWSARATATLVLITTTTTIAVWAIVGV
jgi:hypothetical protein